MQQSSWKCLRASFCLEEVKLLVRFSISLAFSLERASDLAIIKQKLSENTIYYIRLAIQNNIKHMSKELSHLYPDCSSVYNSSRQRSNSVLNQLSYTSRQNIQQSASKSNLNCVKYQQEYQYSSQAPHCKQNLAGTQQYVNFKRNPDLIGNNLQAQNEALRQQLEAQRRNYQVQISKLKRNIILKDQLLDQCEKQISNLKSTYTNLINQFQQIRSSSKSTTIERVEQKMSVEKNPQHSHKGENYKSQKAGEGSLIPLSLARKGVSRSGSVGGAGGQKGLTGQKMTHGLIRGGS